MRLDLKEALPQVAGPVQSLGVPAEVLAELDHGLAGVALELERQPGVLQRHLEPLGGVGTWQAAPTREQRLRVAEQPRIAEGSAAHHDAGAPGVIPHAHARLPPICTSPLPMTGTSSASTTRRDLVPVGPAREHLGAGAGVQRERARARVLHPERDG